MKISLNWIKDFVDLPDLAPSEWAELITLHICEVEGFAEVGQVMKQAQVALVKSLSPHPNAENLCLVGAETAEGILTVVCGAKNFKVGDKVPYLPIGTKLGDGLVLTLRKIRGVESPGMLAAEDELGLSADHTGLMILPADAPTGKKLSELFPDAVDLILEIDNKAITHRPDLWGHYGFARELSAYFGLNLKPFSVGNLPTGTGNPSVTVKIEAPVPRFSAVGIENVEVQPSPAWLAARLQRVGLRSINNLIDITNYLMLELGQPMHAFDFMALSGPELRIGWAKKGDKLTHLYEKEIELTEKDLAFYVQDQPISLAGVIGGLHSGIGSSTKAILLEAANWDAPTVRRTAAHHNVRTDAAQRFEKSLDPEWTTMALVRAWELLLLTCPTAKILGPLIDLRGEKKRPRILNYTPDRAEKLLFGQSHPSSKPEEQKKILTRLGFKVDDQQKIWKVEVPSFRQTKDMLYMQDLVEEVGRMIGYHTISSLAPQISMGLPAVNPSFLLERAVKAHAVGLGYNEILLNPLTSKELEQQYFPKQGEGIKLTNPVSAEQTELRQELLPGLLEAAREQLKENVVGRFFALGKKYSPVAFQRWLEHKDSKKAFASEQALGILLLVPEKSTLEEIFYDWKADLQKLAQACGILQPEWLPTAPQAYQGLLHPTIQWTLQRKDAYAWGGYLSPLYIATRNLKGMFFYAEWDLSKVLNLSKSLPVFVDLPKYPASPFDLTLVLEPHHPFAAVEKAIRQTKLSEVAEVRCLDVYLDPASGKKHITVEVLFRSKEKTFAGSELSKLQQLLMNKLEKQGLALKRPKT